MKIAVAGKGGVGKTSFAARLAKLYAGAGRRVLAVDADPGMNLAYALGLTPEEREKIVPLCDLKQLIDERTGVKNSGGLIILNPKVDDLADIIGVENQGIRLAVMGTVQKGGGGCACGLNAVLKNFLNHVFIAAEDILIVDMEAGVEHLGRASARAVDAMVAVVEGTWQSVEMAQRIKRLAADIGVRKVFVVGNKIAGPEDEQFIRRNFPAEECLGFIPFVQEFSRAQQAETSGGAPILRILESIDAIREQLEKKAQEGAVA